MRELKRMDGELQMTTHYLIRCKKCGCAFTTRLVVDKGNPYDLAATRLISRANQKGWRMVERRGKSKKSALRCPRCVRKR